jgi:hypothetical protein
MKADFTWLPWYNVHTYLIWESANERDTRSHRSDDEASREPIGSRDVHLSLGGTFSVALKRRREWWISLKIERGCSLPNFVPSGPCLVWCRTPVKSQITNLDDSDQFMGEWVHAVFCFDLIFPDRKIEQVIHWSVVVRLIKSHRRQLILFCWHHSLIPGIIQLAQTIPQEWECDLWELLCLWSESCVYDRWHQCQQVGDFEQSSTIEVRADVSDMSEVKIHISTKENELLHGTFWISAINPFKTRSATIIGQSNWKGSVVPKMPNVHCYRLDRPFGWHDALLPRFLGLCIRRSQRHDWDWQICLLALQRLPKIVSLFRSSSIWGARCFCFLLGECPRNLTDISLAIFRPCRILAYAVGWRWKNERLILKT